MKIEENDEFSLFFFGIKIFLPIFALRMRTFLIHKYPMVRWMSGLVTGLQNRLQRFESASDLTKTALE